ncbi:sensor histidine kinase [Massilibacteroides vaginae]|uniref:sensor histidine kinase n=1 Tax=Massilibacteroides vaginae TaxID=1673718 RepID=UPI000A1CCA04|nr:HAMP domain-containing sensor histidine kinase [Massilibacteroides vaginae]
MGNTFRYIVTGVLMFLLLIFSWQVYWLHGLYLSMETDLKRELIRCIETADQTELIYRSDLIESREEKKNNEKSVVISGTTDEEGTLLFQKEERFIDRSKEQNDTIITTSDLALDNTESFFDLLRKSLNESIHDAIDKEVSIDLHRIDSILKNTLTKNNVIIEHYYSELYDNTADSIISTTYTEKLKRKAADKPTIIYPIGSKGYHSYRIYMEPLTQTVLIRMGGILVTTLLIILILAFAFWYLIRTVLNLKTLEEMKDDFTNNMTHELKTPIAVAYSATDALLNFDLSNDQEKRKKYLQICKEQLTRLSNLVEQILSMSIEQRKSFALHPEEIQLKGIINGLIEQHKLKAAKPVSFSINYATDELTLYADRTHLTNMLSNLIDNAIKYSKQETQVIIDIHKQNGIFSLSITDNGQGIPADKQAYIFDKFYRVPHGNQHNVKGYGLGLFYVKVMAEKHGGNVSVKSSPGKGTTFTLQIPTGKENV